MLTEENIIYTIWETVRAAEINQDDGINERLMRDYLRSHRGRHLAKNFESFYELPDECFQYLGEKDFVLEGTNLVHSSLPKMILLKKNQGIRLSKDGVVIPVLNSEQWLNEQKTKFGKPHPSVKIRDTKAFMYRGSYPLCCGQEETPSPLSLLIKDLSLVTQTDVVPFSVEAVLVDPDDAPGYDFSSSPYPMPDNLIEDLINSVTYRDFNVFLKTKSDEVSDMRSNTGSKNTREEI
jgi:hypothetical protein